MRVFCVSLALLSLGSFAAEAADLPYLSNLLPSLPELPPVLKSQPSGWNWTGLYGGFYLGGGEGKTDFSDPRGAAIFGGAVKGPQALGGIQAGFNWQLPGRPFVFGVETDLSVLSSDSTNTCLASSGFFLSANCRVRQDLMSDITARIGLAMGPKGLTLIYAKGGAAWLKGSIDVTTNVTGETTTSETSKFGWIAGAGIEQALSPAWSAKLEYDYADFGSGSAATPASFLQVSPPLGYVATPAGSMAARQAIQTIKLGLNLKLSEDAGARFEDRGPDRSSFNKHDQNPAVEIQVGGRAWFSVGRYQKDLGATADSAQQANLVSRLTYDTDSISGEIFGRIDTTSDVFLKGFVGGGGITSGKMNDEDWLIFGQTVPYSNTVSDPIKGNISYATVDVGYAFLRGQSYKVGGFLGYNYFRENKSAYGCTQIANQNSDCVPSISASVQSLTEDDRWNSFRLGLNGTFEIFSGLTLTADAAYLPVTKLSGVDTHPLRTDVSDQKSPETGNGQGVQLEATLDYALTNAFSVGGGVRYWAMWATSDAYTNIFGTSCPCQTLPSRTDRYGAFVQASYKFGFLD